MSRCAPLLFLALVPPLAGAPLAALRGATGAEPPRALSSRPRLGFLRKDLTGNDPAVDAVVLAAVARPRGSALSSLRRLRPHSHKQLPHAFNRPSRNHLEREGRHGLEVLGDERMS